ncbi:hypothetical protein [Asticcacaulis sp. YBE204]|uniref:hypothetical protein n=1 Tax=Asticcacaulis sp. YBE204 TaxID=1282363 RepID=UPI0003C3BD3C|nr:hypothetical protein [Asticcacaulis sp. YBE204]ESQ81221.1 hypothetical protein AEYBE204_02480 [Asticcacaulis sp. YBE204]
MAKNLTRMVVTALVTFVMAAFLLGVFAGYTGIEKSEALTRFSWVPLIACTIGGFIGLGIAVVWWKRSDEAVREAHKWAWYWGGSVGLIVPAVILGMSMLGIEVLPDAYVASTGLSGPASGILITLLPMFAGYIVAWAVWWLRHR